MIETTQHPEGLGKDEWRLIRLFRCMNRTERNETLVEAGQRLMGRFSVHSYRRYDMTDKYFADEMSPESVEDYDSRLLSAAPMPDGIVLCWENLQDPREFMNDNLANASEIALGTSEFDVDTARELVYAYLVWLEDYNPIQLPKNYFPQEDIDKLLPHEFITFLDEWRERVITTMEKQAEAIDQEQSDAS